MGLVDEQTAKLPELEKAAKTTKEEAAKYERDAAERLTGLREQLTRSGGAFVRAEYDRRVLAGRYLDLLKAACQSQ